MTNVIEALPWNQIKTNRVFSTVKTWLAQSCTYDLCATWTNDRTQKAWFFKRWEKTKATEVWDER